MTKSITPKPNSPLRKSTDSLRIIKKSTCSKISPQARGQLTYHIGYDETAKTFHLRVTENTGGGFFSNEWIGVDSILETIDALPSNDPFKAVIFIPLYNSTSANNHGFLAAALRAEKVLGTVDGHPLSHTLGNIKTFTTAMNKLIKDKVDLHDDVAEAEAMREEKHAEMIERMKSVGKSVAVGKSKSAEK